MISLSRTIALRQTPYQRNAAGKVPRSGREEVHAGLRDVFNAPNGELAQQRARRLMDGWRERYPQLVEWMEETIEQPLTVFELPAAHRKRLRRTNGLERFNQELRRRARVISIFPNRSSCLRLTSALAMEQSEEWLTGHRYVRMDVLEEQSEGQGDQPTLEEIAA